MALNGARLKSALAADLLSQFQSIFPIPSGLLPAEQTAAGNAQTSLANAIANATGPDVVTEITANAALVVSVPGVTAGASTVPGTGTVT